MDYHLLAFYSLYRAPVVRFVRAVVASMLVLLIILGILGRLSPQLPLFILNIQIMLEIFYRYYVATRQSSKTIGQVQEVDALHAITLPAMSTLWQSGTSSETVKRLLTFPQVEFFLARAGISAQELPTSQMGNAILTHFAYKLAKELNGRYVTTMDLVAAHILLEEDTSQLLVKKDLQKKDILQILRWARLTYPYEEHPRSFTPTIGGGGIGEWLAVGWTPETAAFTRNFTYEITSDDVSIIGREEEYEKLKEELLKSENNNVVLIGEGGVGKEQLVRKLAIDSYKNTLDHALGYKTILELLVGSLLAGATSQGDLEERVRAIIDEVSHAGNIILYIPEFQDMIGGSSFSLDLSGALAPYMKNGKLPVIATMTEGNYKTYFEKSSLSELFSPITLNEPTLQQAELMVMEKISEIEEKQSVIVAYSALKAATEYAGRYSQNQSLPGSAIGLLADAISSLHDNKDVSFYDKTQKRLLTDILVLKTIEGRTKIALSEPSDSEKTLLLHLEERLHQSIIGQNEAITVIAEAMRRLRSGVESVDRPISFLFLGPTGVGKTETAKTLSRVYFGGEQNMIRLDMSEYAEMDGQKRLLGALPGQGEERGELTEKVRDHPYSLILLDEFEKAHPSLQSLFLQILDDGRITDNKGRTVSFINTIIIATSNAGSEYIRQAVEKDKASTPTFTKDLLTYLQDQNIFKPELLNRFDGVVTFHPLTESEIEQVTQLLLRDLTEKMQEKNISLTFTQAVLQKVAHEAYNKEFGARPIRRYLQGTIEELLSQGLLQSNIHHGDHITLGVDNNNNFVIEGK